MSYWTDDPARCPFFFSEFFAGAVLATASIPLPAAHALASARVSVEHARPDDDQAQALLVQEGARSPTRSEFARAAERLLRGRDYHPFLFDFVPLGAEEGRRHDALKAHVASAVGLLRAGVADLSPAQVYALFLTPVLQVDEGHDGGRRDWRDELWRLVVNTWERDLAQEEAERQVEERAQVEVIEVQDSIVAGARGWNSDLSSLSPPEQWRWIESHLIANVEDRHHVMGLDGRYSQKSVSARGLRAQVEHLGMQRFIPVVVTKGERTTPADYGQMTQGRMVVCRDHVTEPEIEGGYLQRCGASNPTLVTLSFRRRRDVSPAFHEGVDQWIRRYAREGSKDKYETFCRQIGAFLAWDRGAVAAMSVIAPHGAGKKLHVRGLVECLEFPVLATARDLTQHFNASLLHTPFLSANEGMQLRTGSWRAGDVFRMLVTGDDLAVERKFHDVVTVRNAMRLVFTSNNEGLVLGLCAEQDLAPEDREAIAIRLESYEPGDAPGDFLRSMGGMRWTEGWIEGDSHQPSRLIVARHFLWLWEKYGRDARPYGEHGLLVPGDLFSRIALLMRAQGGSTPTVIEALLGLLSMRTLQLDGRSGVRIDGSRLRVTVATLLSYWREHLTKGSSERLTARRVANSLKGLIVGGHSRRMMIDRQEARWNEIDVVFLHAEAEKLGWTCPRLDDLVRQRLVLVAGEGNGNGGAHAVGAEVGR